MKSSKRTSLLVSLKAWGGGGERENLQDQVQHFTYTHVFAEWTRQGRWVKVVLNPDPPADRLSALSPGQTSSQETGWKIACDIYCCCWSVQDTTFVVRISVLGYVTWGLFIPDFFVTQKKCLVIRFQVSHSCLVKSRMLYSVVFCVCVCSWRRGFVNGKNLPPVRSTRGCTPSRTGWSVWSPRSSSFQGMF